jgi:hypothetical protein
METNRIATQGTNNMRQRLAEIFDGLTLFAIGVTLASGMFLGSGASAIAHGVFLILAATTLILAGFAMASDGRWRIVRSPLWIVLAAWIGLAIVQILPTLSNQLPEAIRPNETGPLSLYRHASLQSLLWMAGGLALLFSISSHVRTGSRFAAMAVGLSLTLWGVGLIGFFQTLADRPQLLGTFELNDPRLPDFVRDIFGGHPATGMIAYHPWEEVGTSDTTFFVPANVTYRLFGGFLDARHWGASVAVMLPMLLAACAYYSSFAGVGGWRTHTQSQQSNLLWLIGLCMAGTAAWMADPVTIPAILTVSLLMVVLLIGRQDRSAACGMGLIYLLVMGGVCGVYWWMNGTPPFLARYQQWVDKSNDFINLWNEHPWWGTGLATTTELGHASTSILSVSSLAALALEVGLFGVGIIGLGILYAFARSLWIYRSLDRDGQVALAGSWGSLVAAGLVSLVGPGIDIAVVIGLTILSLGCLMRTLAVGLKDEEALLAV